MATDFGMFLKLFVAFAATTCFCYLPLLTPIVYQTSEETLLTRTMAEELQLEIQSGIFAAEWSSLGRIAEFLKVACEGKSRLAVAKHVVQRLEEEIGKLKETEIMPYLTDAKKLLTENSSGVKGKSKSEKTVKTTYFIEQRLGPETVVNQRTTQTI